MDRVVEIFECAPWGGRVRGYGFGMLEGMQGEAKLAVAWALGRGRRTEAGWWGWGQARTDRVLRPLNRMGTWRLGGRLGSTVGRAAW